MTISQILEVITHFVGASASTIGESSGALGYVTAFARLFYPTSSNSSVDSTGILRFFIVFSFIGLGVGLIKRIKNAN